MAPVGSRSVPSRSGMALTLVVDGEKDHYGFFSGTYGVRFRSFTTIRGICDGVTYKDVEWLCYAYYRAGATSQASPGYMYTILGQADLAGCVTQWLGEYRMGTINLAVTGPSRPSSRHPRFCCAAPSSVTQRTAGNWPRFDLLYRFGQVPTYKRCGCVRLPTIAAARRGGVFQHR